MQDIHAALREAERVQKKQRTSASATAHCIDSLLQTLREARVQTLQQPQCSTSTESAFLSSVAGRLDENVKVASVQKELHASVSKWGKVLEKVFIPDVCRAYRQDLIFNHETLNKVVVQHLFREGRFEAGEEMCQEAAILDHRPLMLPFVSMHDILKGIASRNLQPALFWVEENRNSFPSISNLSNFEFQLHRLEFLRILETEGAAGALRYAKAYFGRFSYSNTQDIQRLMGCLLFPGRLRQSPYKDMLSNDMWNEVANEFVRQCCGLLGQASDSPLLVTLAAGAASLPQLLKLTLLLKEKGQDVTNCEQLPLELELGQEFVFQSIFACPVSRDQSSPENPPTMLPCGHVLCKQSVLKIAKGTTRTFKCPYCPLEAQQSNCRQLVFPDCI